MIKFIKDIIPKISRYSKKLDDITTLTNQHWVYIDKNNNSKVVFIFRANSDLLISVNGKVEKGKWTYLGNDYLFVERPNESHLYKHGFFDDTVLALKVDGTLDFSVFINETKIGKELNSIENVLNYLDDRYIKFIFQTNVKINMTANSKDFNPVYNENLKWGYSNTSGEQIIPYLFDGAYRFIEDYAIIILAGKYGMIDKKGNYVINPDYEFLEPFSDGLAVARHNKKFGFINMDNKVCIDFIYDDAEGFEQGKAKVKVNGKITFIKK